MTALYIILAVIAVITALVCVRVFICFDCGDSTRLEVRWLFLRFQIYPSKEKEKKKKQKKEKKPEEKKEEKKPAEEKAGRSNPLKDFYANQGFSGVMGLIGETLRILKGTFASILRAFVIEEIYLRVKVAAGDSAATAEKFGKVTAYAYPALGFIFNNIKTRKRDVRFFADFLEEQNGVLLKLKLSVRPIRVINAGIATAFKLLFKVLLKLIMGARSPGTAEEKKRKKAEQKFIAGYKPKQYMQSQKGGKQR